MEERIIFYYCSLFGNVVLIKMASESNTAFPPNNNLVDKFEEAFQVNIIPQYSDHRIKLNPLLFSKS